MYKFIKRLFDLVFAILLMIILAPVIIFLWFALTVSNGGQAFFTQQRVGYRQKVFNFYKFKTMNDDTDDKGKLLPDKDRLTPVGRVIRSLSLDELPQLYNILKSEMSLIGPRPLPVKYLDRYTPNQLRRHDVKPGISGWAQVNGRNAITWDRRFELDLYYVDNISFTLDLKIFWLTIKKILLRSDINASEEVTMTEFKGTIKE
jgi:lipopolysaccharide/colanic/teichoic acid biosynthesis glycosyltransferase